MFTFMTLAEANAEEQTTKAKAAAAAAAAAASAAPDSASAHVSDVLIQVEPQSAAEPIVVASPSGQQDAAEPAAPSTEALLPAGTGESTHAETLVATHAVHVSSEILSATSPGSGASEPAASPGNGETVPLSSENVATA